MYRTRWLKLMKAWGFEQNLEVLSQLDGAYSQSGRYYHNAQHILACLEHLDRISDRLEFPLEVELALWFHDAIYKVFSNDNEQKSAQWARDFLVVNGAQGAAASRVYDLIIATQHNAPATTQDAAWLVDIDLSILGRPAAVYEQFESDIRREYRMVPWFLYRKKRAEILSGFLAREKIYINEPFSTEWEEQARCNMQAAITRLQ